MDDRLPDGAATLITFAAVLHRYGSGIATLQPLLAHINMSWAQELTIYLFVWMAKFGAAYGVRTGIHVGVDVLINRLSDKRRARFIVFGLLAGALFTGTVAVMGADFVWDIAHTDQTSPIWKRRCGWSTWPFLWLFADVLPLPASGLELRQDRLAAQA